MDSRGDQGCMVSCYLSMLPWIVQRTQILPSPLASDTRRNWVKELGMKPLPQLEKLMWEFMLSYCYSASFRMSTKATFTKINDPDHHINTLAK